MTIKWKCSKDGCYVEKQLPDWGMLDGCFGNTKVSPSDFDGYIRQNGRFLFLEKKFPNGILERAQIMAINTAVGQGNSVIAIWCENQDGTDISYMRVWGMPEYDPDRRFQASLDDFRAAVKLWWGRVFTGKLA
jgi:hypothetical protein